MNIDDLREAQSNERRNDSLQELPDSFYSDAADYIGELSEKRDSVDDPFSDEAQRLNDALQTARQVTEAIYERRVGKIVKLSSLSANGVSVDESGMTREERELYENIVDEIQRNQEYVVDEVLENVSQGSEPQSKSDTGDKPQTTNEPKTSEPKPESSVTASSSGNDSHPESVKPENENQDDYETVRVLESMPEFVGTDGRSYSLSSEDVVTLPEKNAEALCEKEAAVKID